jgi:hypothetical protein
LLRRIWIKLGADRPIKIEEVTTTVPGILLQLHVSDSQVVNAWTTPKTGEIFVTKDLLKIVGPNEGELAFVVAHEMGHVIGFQMGWSAQIQQAQLNSDLSSFLNSLGWALLTAKERANRSQQLEENLADALGLYLLVRSGYNPYDAGAFFGRLEMYMGTTGPATREWDKYRNDHPFNEDRIENLRKMMARLAEARRSSNVSSTPQDSCPTGYLRIITHWIAPQRPAESGCVENRNLLDLRPNGSCPGGYFHTAVADPPRNDICEASFAPALKRRVER